MKYHKSWEKFINGSAHFNEMQHFVEITDNICPTKDKVFRFLECDLNNVKCIVLGMDPYPSTYNIDGKILPVATGRAFEVASVDMFTDKYKQQSLSNIFKSLCYYKFGKKYSIEELRSEKIKSKINFLKTYEWFDEMEREGVLFLNAVLTTIVGKSGAHIDKWTDFMNELISYINSNIHCKWLIWGNVALNRVKGLVDDKYIVYSCHPASRQNNNFVEECCFKKVKDIIWF